MTKIQKLKSILKSTDHWYIRLLQWPVILLAYPFLIASCVGLLMFVALTWPFYNWDGDK